jgi:hypothetical protein
LVCSWLFLAFLVPGCGGDHKNTFLDGHRLTAMDGFVGDGDSAACDVVLAPSCVASEREATARATTCAMLAVM